MMHSVYTKGEPQRRPSTPPASPTKSVSSQPSLPTVHPAAAYQKGDAQLSVSLWFVLSGGEKREKNFFKALMDGPFIRSLRVKFLSAKHQGLMPYQMQEQWLKIQREKHLTIDGQDYTLEAFDRVYLLTDVDEFYDQLVQISAVPGPANARWVISNPCFEIWLYYCYLNQPDIDLVQLQNLPPAQLSKALKLRLHQLIPGGVNSELAFEQLKPGIAHSRQHYAEDASGLPICFATQMHQMAADMLAQMERHQHEYTALLQQKAAHRLAIHNNPNESHHYHDLL